MRLVPIKDALTMVGEVVPSVRGKVIDVSKRTSGGSGDKAWAFQKLEIQDDTGKMKAKIWDRDEIPSAVKGQVVTISCKEGDKGMTGIKAKEDEYRGQKSVILNVTATGIIDFGTDGNHAPASQQAPAEQPKQQTSAQAPASNGNGHAPASNGNGGDIKRQLNKMANLYLHCLHAAEYVLTQWETSKGPHGDRVMPEEQFQACVSSLFIESCKSGLYGCVATGTFNKE